MAQLRLYKSFYRINFSTSGESYTLINPTSLSVIVNDVTNSLLVESPTTTQESLGVYYIELTPSLYYYSNIYEATWSIQYINNSSIKTLKTRFKFEATTNYVLGNVVTDIDIELENSRIIDLSIDNSEYIIEIEN